MPRSRSNSDASDSSSSSSVAPVYHLPKLNAAVRQAIEQYDGAVFPKLNWTSPKVSFRFIITLAVIVIRMTGRCFHTSPSILRTVILLLPGGYVLTPQIKRFYLS